VSIEAIEIISNNIDAHIFGYFYWHVVAIKLKTVC
jgi:hypothetical protein